MDKKFGIKHVVAMGIGTAQRYLHFSPLFLVPLLAAPSV